jgi:hypothetical protein
MSTRSGTGVQYSKVLTVVKVANTFLALGCHGCREVERKLTSKLLAKTKTRHEKVGVEIGKM